jgi:hypothetical protein
MDHDHRSSVPAGFDSSPRSVVPKAAQSRAEGGPETLARLCDRYWPPLYALARHGFSPEDARDLVQAGKPISVSSRIEMKYGEI